MNQCWLFARRTPMNKLLWNLVIFTEEKCIWKCCLLNSGHFVPVLMSKCTSYTYHWFLDDVIKRKHFPHYWPFMRGIHPSQRPVTWSFDVSFDLRLKKRLSKQSRRRLFETPSCSLWRHCNVSFSHVWYWKPIIRYLKLLLVLDLAPLLA